MLKKNFVFTLVLLSGCQLAQDTDLAVETPLETDEVKTVLEGELLTAPGKLKSEFIYQFEWQRFLGRADWYYNQQGQMILTVGLNAVNDTSGVSLYGYDEFGDQVLKKRFEKVDNQYQWNSTRTNVFDDAGKLIKHYSRTHNSGQRLIATYHYNEKDLLALIEFGENGVWDRYLYSYDDNDRTIKMEWLSGDPQQPPLIEYFYRYNDRGLLEAKETWMGTVDGDPKKDAFQYFYNEKDQLIEEKEFYPQWGFELFFRKTYEYYPGTEVSGN